MANLGKKQCKTKQRPNSHLYKAGAEECGFHQGANGFPKLNPRIRLSLLQLQGMLGWGRLSQPGGGPWGGPQPTQQCALFGPPVLNRREEKGRTTAAKSSQITNPRTGERREAGVNVTRASSTLEEA